MNMNATDINHHAKKICEFKSEIKHIEQFENTNRKPVGHCNSLSVGGEALEADRVNHKDPMGGETDKVPNVGGLYRAAWDLKPGEPLILEGFVSAQNKSILKRALTTSDKTALVEVEFTVYDYYDPDQKYYKAFHSDGKAVKAKVMESSDGSARFWEVDDEFNEDYTQSLNYRFWIALIGSDKEDQELIYATSPDAPKPYQFGQNVG